MVVVVVVEMEVGSVTEALPATRCGLVRHDNMQQTAEPPPPPPPEAALLSRPHKP